MITSVRKLRVLILSNKEDEKLDAISGNEVMLEINTIIKSIKKSESNIRRYKEKIDSAEEFYESINLFINDFKETIDSHYKQVANYSKMLDKDSTFGNYYELQINKILYGKDNAEINELASNSKTKIIKQINEYEEKIRYEKSNINSCKQKLEKLKSTINSLNI